MAPAAGVTGSLFTMVFDADVRYSGVSIGYTLSQVLGSAFAPTIATALYAATKTSNSIVAYLIAVSGFRRCPSACFPAAGPDPRPNPRVGTDAATSRS